MKRGFIFNGRHLPYAAKLIERARKLRKNMTSEENLLWQNFLRSFQPRFRRQRPIDNYIADFYCAQARLIVEIDGGGHNMSDVRENDQTRTAALGSYDMQVLRFSNRQVSQEFKIVCQQIKETVSQRLNLPPIRGDRGG